MTFSPTKAMNAGLVCLGMLACHPASAQVSGSVSLSGVRYELADLDPDDGIAPALTWTDAKLVNVLGFGEQRAPWSSGGTPLFTPLFDESDVINGQIDASSHLAAGAFQSSATRDGGHVSFAMPLGATLDASITNTRSFQLTPNTLVTFIGDMQGSFSGSIPEWAPNPNGYFDWAYIAVGGLATMTVTGGVDAVRSAHTFEPIGARTNTPGSFSQRPVDTALTVMMANSKATPLSGRLEFTVAADGYTVVPLVPEASTWAQMLLGGGMLCALMHRRRRLVCSESGGRT